MGCCLSRDSDGPPYEPGAINDHHGDSSSRAINANPGFTVVAGERPTLRNSASNSQSSLSTSHPSRSTTRRGRPHPLPLSEHYNRPIRPHVWQSKHRRWSRAQLAREREEFFDTRVTGRPEVWAALSTATGLLREGDIPTAQSIIDAAGVTIPTGDLCEGCYDENGALYRLSEAVVGDPVNILDSAATEDPLKFGKDSEIGDDDDDASNAKLKMDIDSGDKELDEELERKREQKGKRSERDFIKVTARLSDRGGIDVIVEIGKEQTVGSLARKIQNEAGLTDKHRIRIAYLGRILHESDTLLAQGWTNGNIVNALVINRN